MITMVRWLALLGLVVGCTGAPTTVAPLGPPTCPEGSVMLGDGCVWTEVECPGRSQWDGEHCIRTDVEVCPAGTQLEGDHCRTVIVQDCPAGTRFQVGHGCVAEVEAQAQAQVPAEDDPSRKDAACVLDPRKCKSSPPPRTGSAQRLSTSDIKRGIDPVKATAQACGPTHGAAPGTKVAIKITIAGATGTVREAIPVGTHKGTALGECVARAAKAATFTTFVRESMGFQYAFRL